MLPKLNNTLEKVYGKEITENLIASYNEVQNAFLLKKWKYSEIDAGHFVETVRRIIEIELFGGKYTPYANSLPKFNEGILKSCETATGDDSFRILIPRVLYSVYCIRNKRGVGHAGAIKPNEIDATYVLYAVKWILSEIVRLKSNLSAPDTQSLVNMIVEREMELLWEVNGMKIILDSKMPAWKQVLVLLLAKSPTNKLELMKSIEYRNSTDFQKILKLLHKKKLIHCDVKGDCHISSIGIVEAEKIQIASRL